VQPFREENEVNAFQYAKDKFRKEGK